MLIMQHPAARLQPTGFRERSSRANGGVRGLVVLVDCVGGQAGGWPARRGWGWNMADGVSVSVYACVLEWM